MCDKCYASPCNVDYEREPWVYDAGTVRLTFDSNVRAAVGSYDIFDPNLPTIPVLPEGKLVFEVKYTEMQPQIIKDIIPPRGFRVYRGIKIRSLL